MADGLHYTPRPKEYKPPKYGEVEALLSDLKKQRERTNTKISEIKKARRDQWEGVLQQIPSAFRRMAPVMGFPDVAEMGQRIAGMIAKQVPVIEVVPPSGRHEDIRKAAAEESRLHAAWITICDQQERDVDAMGVDAQVHWGESWISVLPDPTRLNYDLEEDDGKKAVKEAERVLGFRRGEDEDADDYVKRTKRMMADGRVPIRIDDYDPQTVYPLWTTDRLAAVIVETEHTAFSIELGLGYKPKRGLDGKVAEWMKGGFTLSEGQVSDLQIAGRVIDTDHDNPKADATGGTGARGGQRVKRVVYMDCWVIQTYLDGILVEEWEHGLCFVPMFPAAGEQSSDREPGEGSRSVIEGALVVAKQLVLWSAMLTANAKLYAWPTPFVKNPEHGFTYTGNEPVVRKVQHGEMNLMGVNEDIVFPFLQAHMGPDFYKNLEFLMARLEGLTMQNWGANLSPETSGYAIAQMRSLQQSILGPIYANRARQRRKCLAMLRHIITAYFPDGIHLRGAVETEEIDGKEYQYAPVVTYAKKDVTDFMINVRIEEGIVQDELAMRKSAIELHQSGAWSMRRLREETGVEDPAREEDEVANERLMNSPAMDQIVIMMAQAMAAERFVATQQQMSTPFMQQLEAAKQQVLGVAAGPGQFANQGGQPQNALPGGQPMQQNPAPAAPQQGGPMAGAPPIEQLGAAGIPGGVKGAPQVMG